MRDSGGDGTFQAAFLSTFANNAIAPDLQVYRTADRWHSTPSSGLGRQWCGLSTLQ